MIHRVKQIAKPAIKQNSVKSKSKGFLHHIKKNTIKLSPKVLSIIDSIGIVSAEYDVHNTELKRLSAILKENQQELLTELEEDYVEVPSTVTSKKYTVAISEPGNVSELVDKDLAIQYLDAVEPGLAYTLLRFALGDLKMYLTTEQYEDVVLTTRKGNRTVKVVTN